MKKTVRKAVIAGNWKMNKTRPEAKALLEELKPMVADVKDVEVVACVPFTNLETVNKRTKAALEAGLKPIVCVGELLWERECNITEEVIARQIKLDFFGISADDLKKCIIAYEPVWAIGTGKTATADQAEEVCAFIRATLAKLYGADVAETITIQYGGSMNAKNAEELLSKTNVDGGLIGGASLKAADFTTIIKAAVNG